jgi:predicted metal-dependent HD superfamily phosphohydrolase
VSGELPVRGYLPELDRARFHRLWTRCAGCDPGDRVTANFETVEGHYLEPHRRYHTPEHVRHCLSQFDDARPRMAAPDCVELAVWYHDVIYDARSSDNELQSAKLFECHAGGVLPVGMIQSVYDLIMVTVHGKVRPKTLDQGYMVDIDLSSFGLPWPEFLRDSAAVRDEFPHLSDDVFYARQQSFLSSLLSREHFCLTAFFRERHEIRARDNISRYLESLEQRGLT